MTRNNTQYHPYSRFRKPPVIIGGCGRSGTTLLQRILSSHREVYGVPIETRLLCPSAYTDSFDIDTPFPLDQFNTKFLRDVSSAKHSRWCEKTPKNILFFGRLLECFGDNIRLLHIVRDGRDVTTSIHPDRPHEYWVSPERWVEDVKSGLQYIGHPQVLTLMYEDLVLNYRPTAKRILHFLDEPCKPSLFENVFENNSGTHKYGIALSPNSIGRWRKKKFSRHVERFNETPGAMELLSFLGYTAPSRKVLDNRLFAIDYRCKYVWP